MFLNNCLVLYTVPLSGPREELSVFDRFEMESQLKLVKEFPTDTMAIAGSSFDDSVQVKDPTRHKTIQNWGYWDDACRGLASEVNGASTSKAKLQSSKPCCTVSRAPESDNEDEEETYYKERNQHQGSSHSAHLGSSGLKEPEPCIRIRKRMFLFAIKA